MLLYYLVFKILLAWFTKIYWWMKLFPKSGKEQWDCKMNHYIYHFPYNTSFFYCYITHTLMQFESFLQSYLSQIQGWHFVLWKVNTRLLLWGKWEESEKPAVEETSHAGLWFELHTCALHACMSLTTEFNTTTGQSPALTILSMCCTGSTEWSSIGVLCNMLPTGVQDFSRQLVLIREALECFLGNPLERFFGS